MNKTVSNSILLTVLNAIGQLVGFVLFAVIAAIFGANWMTDAFFLAITVPSIFVGAAVNAIISVFIPLFTELRIKKSDELSRLIGSALLYTFLISSLASIITLALAPVLVNLTTQRLSIEMRDLAVLNILILLPLIVLQAIIAILTAVINSNNQYWLPAVGFIVRYVSTLLFILLMKETLEILSLPIGFVIGVSIQFCLIIIFWKRVAGAEIQFSRRIEPAVTRSLKLTLPLIVGTIAIQLNILVSRILAAQLIPGSVSVLGYASLISTSIMELLTGGIFLVTLTNWSVIVVEGNLQRLRESLDQLIRIVLFLVMPVVVILFVYRETIISITLGRGEFDLALTVITASVLGYLLIGIPFDVIGRAYVRLFLVWKETWIIGGLAIIRLVSVTLISLGLMAIMGVRGLALADTIGIVIIVVILIQLANRRLGDTFSNLIRPLSKLLIASFGCSLIALIFNQILPDFSIWIKVPVVSTITVISYLGISWLLKVNELNSVYSTIVGIWSR